MSKVLRTLAVGAFVVMALASVGCGSDKKSDVTIEVKAQNTKFLPEAIQVPAGKTVTLKLVNLDSTEHDLEVRGLTPEMMAGGGHDMQGMQSGSSSGKLAVHADAKKTATVDFRTDKKGTYEVFCTIPGHEASGMIAKLVVS